ncbi:hypothetical protein Tco_1141973 [Tanacetum coccineum]
MRTRSQSRNSNRQQQQVPPTFVEPFDLVEPIDNQAPTVVMMADNRTMAQLLEAPTEGYKDAIVVPVITTDKFELKHGVNFSIAKTPEGYEEAIDVPRSPRQFKLKHGIAYSWGNNYNQGQIYQPPVNQPPVHQAPPYQAPAQQTQGMSKDDSQNYVKANDAVMRNMQNQNQNLQNQMTNLTDMLSKFVNSNTASTFQVQGHFPFEIPFTNSKEELKGKLPPEAVCLSKDPRFLRNYLLHLPPTVVERETEVTKDTVPPTNNGSIKDVQPPIVQVQPQVPNSEPVVAPVSTPKPKPKPSIPYPYRLNDQKIREKANNQIEKFYQIFQDSHFDISLADALILMPKFASTLKSLISNKEKLFELARTPLNEHCSTVLLKKLPEKLRDPGKFLIPCDFPRMDKCLAFADLGASINLMPLSVWKKLSLLELTPTFKSDPKSQRLKSSFKISKILGCYNSDFILEEVDAFLALEDDPTSPEVDHSYYDPEGDILLLEAFLNDDPSLPPPTQGNYLPEIRKELKVCEAKNDNSSIDEPPKVELNDLPPHIEYEFLEGHKKLPS